MRVVFSEELAPAHPPSAASGASAADTADARALSASLASLHERARAFFLLLLEQHLGRRPVKARPVRIQYIIYTHAPWLKVRPWQT